MVKTPVYIARYAGDERVERQRVEVRRRFIVTVSKEARFKDEPPVATVSLNSRR